MANADMMTEVANSYTERPNTNAKSVGSDSECILIHVNTD